MCSGLKGRAVSLLLYSGTAYTNMRRVLDTFSVLSCLSCLSTLKFTVLTKPPAH